VGPGDQGARSPLNYGTLNVQAWTAEPSVGTFRKTPVHLDVLSTSALTATATCAGVEGPQDLALTITR